MTFGEHIERFALYMARHWDRVLGYTWEHARLSLLGLAIATVVGVLLGVLISHRRGLAGPVLWLANVIYTIPSIALFGLMIPLLGIGTVPALVALVLYVQLVLIRNTYVGITGVDASLLEAARGMGMTPAQVLWRVRLPLALPVILAGIRTAAVLMVGTATIAAWIGAGGLGVLIVRGLGTTNVAMMLAGAIPSVLLAILFDRLLGVLEGRLVSPGLRGGAGSGRQAGRERAAEVTA